MKSEQPEAMQLPTLPFAVFDESGQPCEDRVRDHFAAAFEALRAQIGQGEPEVSTEHGPWVPSTIHDGETYCKRCLTRSVFAGNRACDPHIVYTHPAPQQKPLTDEHRQELALTLMAAKLAPSGSVPVHCAAFIALCAAHHIGEKK